MPYAEMPKFENVPDKMLEIPSPAIGGLNMKNMEFELDVTQSPYMLNMMYRNGVLGKRYGQEIHGRLDPNRFSDIYASVYYGGHIFMHVRTAEEGHNNSGIVRVDSITDGTANVTFVSGDMGRRYNGQFIIFNRELYYLLPATSGTNGNFYQYDSTSQMFNILEPYCPEVIINCTPDGTTHFEQFEQFNILPDRTNASWKYAVSYNADGTANYKVVSKLKIYTIYNTSDARYVPKVYAWDDTVGDMVLQVAGTDYTYTASTGTVTFNNGKIPAEGVGAVQIIWTLRTAKIKGIQNDFARLLKCKYHATYGATGNGRLFLGGCGDSKYFWSDPWKLNYFPENNWAFVGNTEDDITGFGKQFNTLFIFKPKEVYSLFSYTHDAYTTVNEEMIGEEDFKSMLVNDSIGCDAPKSIQLIDNHLTWFNSKKGVCTLASTSIADERNIRVISTNVEHLNTSYDVNGILDMGENLNKIRSIDYDNKYFLVFPTSGTCFMWDYEISPFVVTTTSTTDPQKLAWFLFDKFYIDDFLKVDNDLLYYSTRNVFANVLVKLNSSFRDLDFNQDGEDDSINAYYMTPFFQFNAVDYLKNVKNIYVQCRGDTATAIEMYYHSEDAQSSGIKEPDDIRIGGKIWKHFRWDTFDWNIIGHASVFRRKCNLKKVQMVAFLFKNDEAGRDLSITHLGVQYQLVKYIR